ncbi:MAG: SCO family protein [Acidimicrobiia bacterium]|nr:SCO family protein [Acidimicrobiia bacterium]
MRRSALILASAVAGVLVAFVFLSLRGEPHTFAGTVYSNPGAAPAFSLTDDSGEAGSLSDYRGKVVLLYFGYTFCPDICPASLAELATAVAALDPGDRDRVQVMMISVDPARDTPEALGSYMDYFDPSFVGFTGTDDQIATVAADYGVFYQAHEGTAATGYLVDHWAGTYLIDAEGRLVESFGFGTPGEDIAADVEEWL